VSLLEKVSYDHAEAIVQPEFLISTNDIKNPSAKAATLSGKFYSEVWLKGGREIANEAIRKNEKSLMLPWKRPGKLKKLQNMQDL
jgi:hypothetical protein